MMIQDDENGKTLHYIKKLSKEKNQKYIEVKGKNSDENIKEESPKKVTDYNINVNQFENQKEKDVQPNKNFEIKIPESEIEALRRIKSKIDNYKKNQKMSRNNRCRYIKLEKYKSCSFFHIKKNPEAWRQT